MNLSLEIKKIRKLNNLTQKDFADKLFVTRQAVTRWEAGETTPTIETLKAIIDAFNIDANALFDSTSVCQSCGRQLENLDDIGTNADRTANNDYCNPCITDGVLYPANSLDEWVDLCIEYMDDKSSEAKEQFKEHLKSLKRWNNA